MVEDIDQEIEQVEEVILDSIDDKANHIETEVSGNRLPYDTVRIKLQSDHRIKMNRVFRAIRRREDLVLSDIYFFSNDRLWIEVIYLRSVEGELYLQ